MIIDTFCLYIQRNLSYSNLKPIPKTRYASSGNLPLSLTLKLYKQQLFCLPPKESHCLSKQSPTLHKNSTRENKTLTSPFPLRFITRSSLLFLILQIILLLHLEGMCMHKYVPICTHIHALAHKWMNYVCTGITMAFRQISCYNKCTSDVKKVDFGKMKVF